MGTKVVKSTAKYVGVNPAQPGVLLTEDDFTTFSKQLQNAGLSCDQYYCSSSSLCSAFKLPTLEMTLGNYTYSLMPASYALSNRTDYGCLVMISYTPNSDNPNSAYVLGDVFIQNYVTQLYFDN